PVALPLFATFFVRIYERNDVHVGVVDVRAHVQVVDATQPDKRGAHRTVIRREAHARILPTTWRSSPFRAQPRTGRRPGDRSACERAFAGRAGLTSARCRQPTEL